MSDSQVEVQRPDRLGAQPAGRRCATSSRPRSAAPSSCSAAAVAALAWANIDLHSYESVWHTELSIQVGSSGISQDLRDWVNSGLMTFFFFVVGLEVRREFDVGELRERRRLALPVLAGLGGMVVPIAIYLAFNAGERSAPRLGRGDVDRHRVRARHARPGRAALPRPAARLPADDHRRRRRRRPARHRRRLQRRRSTSCRC